ncbi:chromate resistance protein ChrB domain-containing protein [Desulfobacula sp.]|uniref:chromate resistance protein ChrB domain-containing protein n=1 Tax=Desulfobacula sp. TaxID=2593537 RepID=UPI00260A0956|nr:chromate resistance protein ChrB domain-containing protein [Desulfobacula sp.]
MKKALFAMMFLLVYPVGNVRPETYVTWDGLEADKLASIWLIQRFISPDAKIRLYPKGQTPGTGIQFDTPYSPIRRRFNQSTFESLLAHYHLSDPKLHSIARLIHDIEINVWEKKVFQKTREMEFFFMDLLSSSLEDKTIIQKAGDYFDRLYQAVPDTMIQQPKTK